MRRPSVALLSVALAAMLGAATNVATNVLPASWRPYLWIAWPVVGLLVLVIAVLELTGRDAGAGAAAGSAGNARRILLDRVRRYWVDSVLERSLHHEARIELGMAAAAGGHPWDLRAVRGGQTEHAVSPGTPMSKLFAELDSAVVITGAPGSGKSSTLLELARDLLGRAAADPDEPVPVVLNLSSWAVRRPSLDEWIANELTERYGIPSEVAAEWVAARQVLPLLDGLDEVAGEHRAGCLTAINEFRRRHGIVPIAVCCRLAEYEPFRGRLAVYGTVTIQPLSRPQVTNFLDRAGPSVAGLRDAVTVDPGLWELLDSPLMLSIMALAFRDGLPATAKSTEDRRRHLYATYVDKMLAHRPNPAYPPDSTVHRLAVLAGNLGRTDQTVFTLDLLSPSWRSSGRLPVAPARTAQPRRPDRRSIRHVVDDGVAGRPAGGAEPSPAAAAADRCPVRGAVGHVLGLRGGAAHRMAGHRR